MSVIHNAKLPRAALPGLEHKTLAGSENGLKNLSIWQQSIEPGAASIRFILDGNESTILSPSV